MVATGLIITGIQPLPLELSYAAFIAALGTALAIILAPVNLPWM